MILVIDNYDSFVFNLARYVEELGYPTLIYRNDKIGIKEILELQPSHIILSPGPCAPDQAGICLAILQAFAEKIPILGVCLGHQVIGQVYGGQISPARKPMHGKPSQINHQGTGIFQGLANPLQVGRYHSLIVEGNPQGLNITSYSEEGEIMSLESSSGNVVGVQFHPESLLTEQGHALLQNFITGSTKLP